MTPIRATLPDFERHLFATARTALKYQALQLGEMRALCDWHERTYGLSLLAADLTPETLRLYIAHRRTFDAIATLNRKRAAWQAYCRWALARGVIDANPCERVRRLPQPRRILRNPARQNPL